MNYGINLEKELASHTEEDRLGADAFVGLAQIPQADRWKYLPAGEVQRGKGDWMDCATRGPVNDIEKDLNFLYLNGLLTDEELKFYKKWRYIDPTTDRFLLSNRFNAILSGTDERGNSLKAPLQSLHEHGYIPRWMLPETDDMTFSQYHDARDIAQEMKNLGKQAKSRIDVRYSRVTFKEYAEAIKKTSLVIALHAWPKPKKGIYPPTSQSANHCVIWFDGKHLIFDNYIDKVDGDFIKRLDPRYDIGNYAYVTYLVRTTVTVDRSILDELIAALAEGRYWDISAIIAKRLGTWLGFAR